MCICHMFIKVLTYLLTLLTYLSMNRNVHSTVQCNHHDGSAIGRNTMHTKLLLLLQHLHLLCNIHRQIHSDI